MVGSRQWNRTGPVTNSREEHDQEPDSDFNENPLRDRRKEPVALETTVRFGVELILLYPVYLTHILLSPPETRKKTT